MAKKIFYEKQGRRYIPVSEYDSDLLDAFPKGSHLVMSYPGGVSRRFNVDPNYAAMIAAGRIAEDTMARAIVKASEMRPRKTPITLGQKRAWEALAKEFGEELATLEIPCARDIAEAGIKAMIDEADSLLKNPAVRRSFDNFVLLCKLAKEEELPK